MRMIAAVSSVSPGTLRILGMEPATQGSAIRARARRKKASMTWQSAVSVISVVLLGPAGLVVVHRRLDGFLLT